MSGETEQNISGWTVDTAREDLLNRINTLIKEFDDYKEDIKLRFIEVNEFRKSLDDLGKTMQTKSEAAQFQESYVHRHDEVVNAISELRSRLDVGNPAIGSIQQQLAASQGIKQGGEITMGKIIAVVGVIVSVAGLFITMAVLAFNN